MISEQCYIFPSWTIQIDTSTPVSRIRESFLRTKKPFHIKWSYKVEMENCWCCCMFPTAQSSQTRTLWHWIKAGSLSFEMLPLIVDAETTGWIARARRMKVVEVANISNLSILHEGDKAALLHFTAALCFIIWNGKMFQFNRRNFMTKRSRIVKEMSSYGRRES